MRRTRLSRAEPAGKQRTGSSRGPGTTGRLRRSSPQKAASRRPNRKCQGGNQQPARNEHPQPWRQEDEAGRSRRWRVPCMPTASNCDSRISERERLNEIRDAEADNPSPPRMERSRVPASHTADGDAFHTIRRAPRGTREHAVDCLCRHWMSCRRDHSKRPTCGSGARFDQTEIGHQPYSPLAVSRTCPNPSIRRTAARL